MCSWRICPRSIPTSSWPEAFDAFGIVLSASIARDPTTGKRLRYGFVDIATERAAKLAVESMNGAAVDGYNLDVRISERPTAAKKPPRPRSGPGRSPPARPAARPRLDELGDGEADRFSPRARLQSRRQPSSGGAPIVAAAARLTPAGMLGSDGPAASIPARLELSMVSRDRRRLCRPRKRREMAVIALADEIELEAKAMHMHLLGARQGEAPPRRMRRVVDVERLAAAVA